MREAANRVLALLSDRMSPGASGDPMTRAMHQMEDAIAAVPPDDPRAQRVMTERLRHLHDRLLEDPTHTDHLTVVAWRKVTGQVLPVPASKSAARPNPSRPPP